MDLSNVISPLIVINQKTGHRNYHYEASSLLSLEAEPFEQKRILGPIRDCLRGNIKAVQKTYSEAQLFVRAQLFDGRNILVDMIRIQIAYGNIADLGSVLVFFSELSFSLNPRKKWLFLCSKARL